MHVECESEQANVLHSKITNSSLKFPHNTFDDQVNLVKPGWNGLSTGRIFRTFAMHMCVWGSGDDSAGPHCFPNWSDRGTPYSFVRSVFQKHTLGRNTLARYHRYQTLYCFPTKSKVGRLPEFMEHLSQCVPMFSVFLFHVLFLCLWCLLQTVGKKSGESYASFPRHKYACYSTILSRLLLTVFISPLPTGR